MKLEDSKEIEAIVNEGPIEKSRTDCLLNYLKDRINENYPCLHFEFWSWGKSSSPPYELSFGGDELWISDARSLSMLG